MNCVRATLYKLIHTGSVLRWGELEFALHVFVGELEPKQPSI